MYCTPSWVPNEADALRPLSGGPISAGWNTPRCTSRSRLLPTSVMNCRRRCRGRRRPPCRAGHEGGGGDVDLPVRPWRDQGLARPALGAVAIFTFLHSWNLYLEPIVFLSTSSKFTLPQALTQFVDAYGGPMWNVQLAAASLTAIPVLIVFVIAQRQFIEGLAHTAVKG